MTRFRDVWCACIVAMSAAVAAAQPADPLPSWNDDGAQARIVEFVEATVDPSSIKYVPEINRIAVFDNDGTLWAEQPAYFQLLFVIDRVRALSKQHPDWLQKEPFKSAIVGDMKALAAQGDKALLDLVIATHSGMTTDEFEAIVREWLSTAKHPTTHKPYTDMIYQPMLELLAYLQDNGFKTFIVSGGGVEFMRVFSEDVYGIPPEQVVGSTIKTKFEMKNGEPVITRLPEVDFIDDKAGKPVGINKFIGRQPIFAAGNSDGDLQMLQWTSRAGDTGFCLLVHHTDATREWSYGKDSSIGRLDAALREAQKHDWLVVDMENDWSQVFFWQD